jgi:hydrogenase expression/formation protein HypC
MCLAVPVKVVELGAGDAALVDLGGIRKQISLALVEDVAVGDYVILHVGYALTRLDPAEAERTLALFAEAGVASAGSDLASTFAGEVGSGMGLEFEADHGSPSAPAGSGPGQALEAEGNGMAAPTERSG